MSESAIATRLPENAYRELKPGETYTPMVPAGVTVPEITTRSIVFGIVMNLIFSMAATYLALKVGQGIETAIPISILAVGLSGVLLRMGRRRSTLLENVNILAISTTSGIVAGGTVFTMPAIYILRLHEKLNIGNVALFFQIFLVPLLGAALGVVFLVPFRRYFVREMHGKLRFPEGTATNEILVTGAGGGGGQAWVLIYSFVLGAAYNWVSGAMKLFTETFSSAAIPALHSVTERVKAVFTLGTGAEFVGLGYIIGVRYASIIVAGSFLSWFVIIPLLAPLGLETLRRLNPVVEAHHGPPGTTAALTLGDSLAERLDEVKKPGLSKPEIKELNRAIVAELRPIFAQAGPAIESDEAKLSVSKLGAAWKLKDERQSYILKRDEAKRTIDVYPLEPGAEDIFIPVPRNMGIGCIFAAGILSILKMSKVIATALRQALGGLLRSKGSAVEDRTDTDISYPGLLGIGAATSAAIFVYFRFVVLSEMPGATRLAAISLLLALAIAFVFTTVSAWAIAMISVTPISGMTVTTIIITAVFLLAAGLPKSDAGMLATLLVGGVVASALSMAGTLVTEFKIGYWLGATPRKIQWSAVIAAVLASAVVTGTIMILAVSPGYDAKTSIDALQAPQANLMASALKSFLGTGEVPWTLYGTGVVIALLLQILGISPLAFGLGMYLPMELNTPILVGAIVAWAVQHSTRDAALSKGRNDKGILLASGLIAGAAIIGVVRSVVKLVSPATLDSMDLSSRLPAADSDGNWLGLIAFVGLCLIVYLDCLRARRAESEGPSLSH